MVIKKIFIRIYRAVKSVFGGYKIGEFYPIKIIHHFILKNVNIEFCLCSGT